ncbi:MAG TPA: hypothetical protein VFE62_06715 [Gemmataceae bacterium]|nr:hypothetical protein [Gemmataceae bacterium]
MPAPSELPSSSSPAVTIVAIADFVMGTGRIALGVAVAWYVVDLIATGPDEKADLLQFLGFLLLVFVWPLLVLLGLLSIIAGLLLIIAGMGLLRRQRSARTLTLVMGALGGGLAVFYAMNLLGSIGDRSMEEAAFSIAGMTIHGTYCVLVFSVLLNPRIAAEFTPEIAAARLR